MLAVAAPVTNPQWTVLIEQPTSDAFAVAHSLERQLTLAIALALLGTVVLGWVWGRSFIQRIFALTRVTRAIAEGNMDERVVAPRPGRNPPARRRLQLDGRSAGRAAGERPQAGTPGDVRPHRRRPGARSLAPDSEHRQQLQADSEDVRGRRVPRDVPQNRRARAGHRQARARRPAQHRAADPARALCRST